MTTEPLRVKNFLVIIWKNDLTLYRLDGMKLVIFNAKHWFMMFQEMNKKQYIQAAFIKIVSETLIDLWHHHLAHINYSTICKLSAVTKSVMIMNSEAACDSCSMIKVTQKISCRPMTRIKKLLKLIYTDLVNLVAITLTGECYYILFKNDYSDVVKMYGLKLKDQVYDKYAEYKALVENYLKSIIKCL